MPALMDLFELRDHLAEAFMTPDAETVVVKPNPWGGFDVISRDMAPNVLRLFPIDGEWSSGAQIQVLDDSGGVDLMVSVRGRFSERGLAAIAAAVI